MGRRRGGGQYELHHNPKFIIHEQTVDIVNNVVLLILAHHNNLVDDEFLLRLLLQVHLLDGHCLARLRVGRCVHHARGTLANLLLVDVAFRRDSGTNNLTQSCQYLVDARVLSVGSNMSARAGVYTCACNPTMTLSTREMVS